MSNTKRDNLNVKINRYYEEVWNNRSWYEPPKAPDYELMHSLGLREEDLEEHSRKFAKGPSWFHHMVTTIPNRRKEREALRKIARLKDYEDWDSSEFPVDKKPKDYWL